MLSWLLEIFASSDSKARLITVIITALVAITVVLINQKIISLRENRAKYIERVERLYSTNKSFIIAINDMVDAIRHSDYDKYRSSEMEASKLFQELDMVEQLYFPNLNIQHDDFMCAFSWVQGFSEEDVKEGVTDPYYSNGWVAISRYSMGISKVCKLLVNNHDRSRKVKAKMREAQMDLMSIIGDFLSKLEKDGKLDKEKL
jgi:hypothetical protein